MEFDCPKCGEYFTVPFPFGDDVTCPHCNTEFTTEFEYLSYDSLTAWITGEKKEDYIQ